MCETVIFKALTVELSRVLAKFLIRRDWSLIKSGRCCSCSRTACSARNRDSTGHASLSLASPTLCARLATLIRCLGAQNRGLSTNSSLDAAAASACLSVRMAARTASAALWVAIQKDKNRPKMA